MTGLLEQAQQAVDAIAPAMGGYWDGSRITLKMTEELGEFAQARRKHPEKTQAELTDLLFAVLCYANSHQYNLSDSLESMLKKISGQGATS